MLLRRLDLRSYLVVRLTERDGVVSVAALLADLRAEGFSVVGRPARTVSDAFRAELARGRVERRGRGRYAVAVLPRTTKHRMVHRVAELRAAVRAGDDFAPLPGFDPRPTHHPPYQRSLPRSA